MGQPAARAQRRRRVAVDRRPGDAPCGALASVEPGTNRLERLAVEHGRSDGEYRRSRGLLGDGEFLVPAGQGVVSRLAAVERGAAGVVEGARHLFQLRASVEKRREPVAERRREV